VIVAACAYEPRIPPGPLAAYAARTDYHVELRRALEETVASFRERAPGARWRVAVDTAPLLERAYAMRAGLGWIGRSTNLVTERFGPYVLLAEILTDLEIEPDAPHPDLCGECGQCLDACPTGALTAPRVLDARRCISYLTIEKRGPFTAEEKLWVTGHTAGDDFGRTAAGDFGRTAAGDFGRTAGDDRPDTFAFGCDLCLAACPHAEALIAGSARPAGKLVPTLPELAAADAATLEALAKDGFKRTFGRTPVTRAGKKGLLRNLDAATRPDPDCTP
jgi:epoxyqueuosine reductase